MKAEKIVRAGNIQLAVQEFGEAEHPAIVLIMGLGTQMISWPEPFCQGLADLGYRVIRFDNRDIGLSYKVEGVRAPSALKMMLSSKIGMQLKVPYHLRDMAGDTVALLDALGIEAAHIVGASMGGMIAQLMAAHYPERVRTLTSIMSTSGDRKLPLPKTKVLLRLAAKSASDEASFLESAVRTWRIIGSPAYQPEEATLREKLLQSYRRSYYPAGAARQMAAIAACGSRVEALKLIRAPTLVIHGKDDPLVPVSGGIDTAKHIRNARLELIDGMGHDLPAPLIPHFIKLISSHIQSQNSVEAVPA
ncbi:MAG: pimeloyl-ACP methyl ester carboxylesterase [Bacteroidia bacterium]|jgi:pimeloyl-ACP methyl ester carboxylesterase